jgi:hypothetical protein
MKAFVVDEPRTGALRALNYSPAVERIRRAGSSSARPLHEIVKTFGPGWRRAFARIPCSAGHGVEFLSQGDIFAAEPSGRQIRIDSMSEPARYKIEVGQVLLAGTGTLGENELYGRAMLADGRLAGKYLTEDAMALVFEEPGSDFALFAYAWLASPTGLQILRSTSYGTKLLRFRRDLLQTLPVPEAGHSIVGTVSDLIRKVIHGRELYLAKTNAAKAVVERHFTPAEIAEAANERARVVSVWTGALPTLRAWNFGSAGSILSGGKVRWGTTLRDWLEPGGLFMGARVARIPCTNPFGVDLLSQRDVCLIRPAPRRIKQTDPSLLVKPNWLLLASRGQMTEGALFGSVERARHMPDGAAISGDVMRLVPTSGLEAALYAFLSTNCGRRLLQSTAYGTSIPAMREDLLLDLPAPPPEGAWVNEVSHLVEQATKARNNAAAAEAEAIRIIEEEVLPQWLA